MSNGSASPTRQTSLDVVFLALGSIGDCLPLCALAAGCSVPACVVTHECHCQLLQDLMKNTYVVEPLPRIHSVKIPVLFGSSSVSNAASATSQGRKRARGQTGATSDFADKNGPGDEHEDGDEDESHVVQELDGLMHVLENLKPKMLVFNLFSAFGYHLADALGIPCLCASPGVPPRWGEVPLGRVLPRALLERMNDGDRGSGSGDEVTKADLELWMLPLFHPRYRRWRRGRGLPGDFLSSALPRAPPILFGVSPAVLPRPGYWPSKADVCGFWSFSRLSPRYRPPERLVRFLLMCEEEGKPVFAVGLGSMPELGLVKNPRRILDVAISCLRKAGAAIILLPTGAAVAAPTVECQPAHAALQHRGTTGGGDCGWEQEDTGVLDLNLIGEAFVPHQWLLPRCRGIVHHGGSGTTGAAISAGVVQVIIPLAFDQFFFADQMEYIGVGTRVEGTRPTPALQNSTRPLDAEGDGVTIAGMGKALRVVLTEEMKAAAHGYRELVDNERGVQIACAKISAILASHIGPVAPVVQLVPSKSSEG